jgi:hypothetical protein
LLLLIACQSFDQGNNSRTSFRNFTDHALSEVQDPSTQIPEATKHDFSKTMSFRHPRPFSANPRSNSSMIFLKW